MAIAAGCLAVLGSSDPGPLVGAKHHASSAEAPLATRATSVGIDHVAMLTEGPASALVAAVRRGLPDGAAKHLPLTLAMLSSACGGGFLASGRLGPRATRDVARFRLCLPYGVRAPPHPIFA
jgi:hypothetical protein